MRRILIRSLIAGLLAGTPLLARTFECDGDFGPHEVFDKLVVPEGANCVLYLSEVKGNVEVKPGAGFAALGSTIHGDLKAREALIVYLVQSEPVDPALATPSRVEGDVDIRGTRLTGVNVLCETTIGGKLKLEKNLAFSNLGDPGHCFAGVSVQKSVVVKKNTGGVLISGNRIGGNLNCKDNQPAPTGIPGSNRVGGKAKGQCRALAGS